MNYGYVRVSSITQNIDRQMEEMHKWGLNDKYIYVDKQSGKDFERPNYQIMKKKLKKDDLLIIKSIDRLGRNYEMIIKEWQELTKEINCDIVVIDFPLLDTRMDAENLVGKFISDIVLQVLSFVAQNERENIKSRQAEGIRIAKEKGVQFGRPKLELPCNFDDIAKLFITHKIRVNEACKKLSMSKGSFYRYLKLKFNYTPRKYKKESC